MPVGGSAFNAICKHGLNSQEADKQIMYNKGGWRVIPAYPGLAHGRKLDVARQHAPFWAETRYRAETRPALGENSMSHETTSRSGAKTRCYAKTRPVLGRKLETRCRKDRTPFWGENSISRGPRPVLGRKLDIARKPAPVWGENSIHRTHRIIFPPISP